MNKIAEIAERIARDMVSGRDAKFMVRVPESKAGRANNALYQLGYDLMDEGEDFE